MDSVEESTEIIIEAEPELIEEHMMALPGGSEISVIKGGVIESIVHFAESDDKDYERSFILDQVKFDKYSSILDSASSISNRLISSEEKDRIALFKMNERVLQYMDPSKGIKMMKLIKP